MLNVDIEIYLAELKKFFKENPNDLIDVIGDSDSGKFFDEVKKQALLNVNNGEDPQLTKGQMMSIVFDLKKSSLFFTTPLGDVCLN